MPPLAGQLAQLGTVLQRLRQHVFVRRGRRHLGRRACRSRRYRRLGSASRNRSWSLADAHDVLRANDGRARVLHGHLRREHVVVGGRAGRLPALRVSSRCRCLLREVLLRRSSSAPWRPARRRRRVDTSLATACRKRRSCWSASGVADARGANGGAHLAPREDRLRHPHLGDVGGPAGRRRSR